MNLSILGWETRGLRCPDVTLNFEKGDQRPHAVTLLQMPNGTGKTTTLDLIRATLDGTAAQWDAKKVRDFRRAHSDESDGLFTLRLALDQEPLTFKLKLDFDEGVARYTTQYRSKNVERHEPPAASARFLRKEFVQLFIFDGEYASELFDASQSEARKAITNLFQLYLFEDLEEAADAHLKAKIREIGTQGQSRSKAAVQKLRGELEAADQKVKKLKQIEKDANKELATSASRLEALDKKEMALKEQSKGLHEKKATALREQAQADQAAKDALQHLVNTLRQPLCVHPSFGRGLRELIDGLEKLQLPANTAAQWFEELAAEDNETCICGRPLGHQERDNILAMKERYLGTDVHSVLNAIKNHATQALAEPALQGAAASTLLADASKETLVTERKKRESASRLKAAEKALAEQGNEEEQRIAKEALELRPKVAEYQEALKRLALPTGDMSIKAAEQQRDKITAELTKTTQTAELNAKIKTLKSILADAAERADATLREEVKTKCNERLKRVLSNDPLSIGSIEHSLALEGQRGASMGQTLAVGYTFLVTLLNEGNQSFPLVVDSPAGPLDHSIRREVARIIPAMSEQFLAFTISTEREGFVTTLADAVAATGSDQVQFLTLVRLTDGTRPLIASAPPGRTETTENSALVQDREFFESFNLDEEEEDDA